MKVAVVSRNLGKLRELRELVPDWELELLDTTGIGEETGATFYENARAKAVFGRAAAPEDVWVLGEDSGLEIDALGGAPGIRSARFAGAGAGDAENLRRALDELERAARSDRRARYRCEVVLLDPEGDELRGSGTLEGTIAAAPRGTGGFGYDPVFVPEGERRTVAELGDAWKARHSHRARAVGALLAALNARESRR